MSALNQFDFYSVFATASTKTALKKAGIDPAKIERRAAGSVSYGRQTFRRWSYRATVKYFELFQQEEAYAFAGQQETQHPGVLFGVHYHAVD